MEMNHEAYQQGYQDFLKEAGLYESFIEPWWKPMMAYNPIIDPRATQHSTYGRKQLKEKNPLPQGVRTLAENLAWKQYDRDRKGPGPLGGEGVTLRDSAGNQKYDFTDDFSSNDLRPPGLVRPDAFLEQAKTDYAHRIAPFK